MMLQAHPGGDPRRFTEFETIKAEINKLSQASQPVPDWALIDISARALFEKNGVDLLTACYFTLARTQIYGLKGFTEGCEVVAALVSGHWESAFWPEQPEQRIGALDWFNSRPGRLIRQQAFTLPQQPLLVRASCALEKIADKLEQIPLSRASRIENLYIFIQNQLDKLAKENRPLPQPTITVPANTIRNVTLPHVPTREPAPVPPRPIQWKGFCLGALTAAVIAGLFCYSSVRRQTIVDHASAPSMSWFIARSPALADGIAARDETADVKNAGQDILASYRIQLAQLAQFSPLSHWIYGDNLLHAARLWWPEDPQQKQLAAFWREQLQAQADYPLKIDGYDRIRTHLTELTQQIDNATRQDKYITVTYLNTMLQRIKTEQNAEIPVEELLRQIEEHRRQGSLVPEELQRSLSQKLQTITARYYQATTLYPKQPLPK